MENGQSYIQAIPPYAEVANSPAWAVAALQGLILSDAGRREPNEVIGRAGAPYLLRWHLRREDACSLYLHKFVGPDPDVPHDHPADSTSIVLAGGYDEQVEDGSIHYRAPGEVLHRSAEQKHRVILRARPDGTLIAAWSLFIFAQRRREWGFHCEAGWRHWKEFTARAADGDLRGCGEA